jgi:hypothetical protein
MRRSRILAVAAALLGLLLVPVASAGRGGSERPFQATLVGSVHWEYPGASPSNCTAVTTLSEGTGQATHLGRVTAAWSHCPTEPDYVMDGRVTLTAASGDHVYGTYDYQPGSGEVSPVVVTGGTGRFSEATGTLTLTYWVIPVFWPMPPCDPDTDPMGCVNVTVPWQAGWSISGTLGY